MLEANRCSYFVGDKGLVCDVSLSVEPGCVTAFMGPNGAGKSTLMKLLSGQVQPSAGEVLFDGRRLDAYSIPELAQRRAVLVQSRAVGFPFAALEVVLFGRNPHTGRGESDRDYDIARGALIQTDALHLGDRIYNTLSGGEAARVDLARVLAQQTDVILLDEPTNHLDPRHQLAVLQLCRTLAGEGRSVVVCLHDLTLCAHYCDRVLLMKDGAAVAYGPPEETLTAGTLQEVYDTPFAIIRHPGMPVCIVPMPSSHQSTPPLADHKEHVLA